MKIGLVKTFDLLPLDEISQIDMYQIGTVNIKAPLF
jgi:hypothetical protein